MGYAQVGFSVDGIDIEPQPRYPFHFTQADAIAYVREHGYKYDAVHASPPCQAHTKAQRIQGNTHIDLIGPTRDALNELGKPYIIEKRRRCTTA